MTAHDLLTRAAAKVRETAGTSTRGPWQVGQDVDSGEQFVYDARWTELAQVAEWSTGLGNPEHIALWDPPTALAAIEQLDLAARDLWAHGLPEGCDTCDGCMECDDLLYAPYVRAALALARSILEED